jgi:hypothetical protein
MNPPISGQNIGETYLAQRRAGSSRVQRDLLARRGECPRDLQPALLAEDEAQLARRPQAVGMGWSEGAAGTRLRYRTEEILVKEAVLAARFRCPSPTVCHAQLRPVRVSEYRRRLGHQSDFTPLVQRPTPENAGNF